MYHLKQCAAHSLAALSLVLGLLPGPGAAATAEAVKKAVEPAPASQPAAETAAPQAPPSAAAPVPPPMPATKTMEIVDNPYGLGAVWAQGDFVARGTLIIMVIMSIGSWYILLTKLLEQRKLFADADKVRQSFWKAGTLEQGLATLSPVGAFHYVCGNALEASREHSGALAKEVSLSNWIEMGFERSFEEIQSRLQVGLAFLGTVGSTAPFVGLFGTVWGIYHALTAIGIAGQASIDKVSGPVGESLIMTAIGLAVAVPAVLGYNWLVRRNKSAMAHVHAFAADLEKVLLGGNRPGAKR